MLYNLKNLKIFLLVHFLSLLKIFVFYIINFNIKFLEIVFEIFVVLEYYFIILYILFINIIVFL